MAGSGPGNFGYRCNQCNRERLGQRNAESPVRSVWVSPESWEKAKQRARSDGMTAGIYIETLVGEDDDTSPLTADSVTRGVHRYFQIPDEGWTALTRKAQLRGCTRSRYVRWLIENDKNYEP